MSTPRGDHGSGQGGTPPQPGVFHPGHDALHGKTVVVYTSGARTYIGRWGEADARHVHMMGVCCHEEGRSADSRDEWVARMKQFGFPVEQATASLPREQVVRVVHLSEA